MDYPLARASRRDHRCISMWGTLIPEVNRNQGDSYPACNTEIPWVIDHERIGSQRATNNHTIHHMCHVFWVGAIAVFLVMEVAQQEEWHPCVLILSYTMNKQEGWGKTILIFTQDSIHHPSSMRDCVKLEVARHLLLGEVGLSHMDHYFLMEFHETVLVYSRRYPKYSSLTLLLYPSLLCS